MKIIVLSRKLFLVSLVAFIGFSQLAVAAKGKGRAAPVVVELAVIKKMSPISWVSGTVISRNDAELAAEVKGQLKKVAEAGDFITVNGVVAKIDNTFAKLTIEELKAAVEREKAQLHFLREEMKRLKRLAKQNNAAKTRLEQTQADKKMKKSDLDIARTRLLFAREELSRHIIRAPFSGVVAQRHAQPGERVDVGDPIVRLIDPNALEVQARVPLSSINYMFENTELRMRVGDSSSESTKGIVRTIVPVGHERSRLLDMRIDFKNPMWRVGQPLRVALPTAKPREMLAVPRDALVLRRDGASVFKVNIENKAEKVTVIVGVAEGDYVGVTGNLVAEDKVVVRGGERLRPGQSVTIVAQEK